MAWTAVQNPVAGFDLARVEFDGESLGVFSSPDFFKIDFAENIKDGRFPNNSFLECGGNLNIACIFRRAQELGWSNYHKNVFGLSNRTPDWQFSRMMFCPEMQFRQISRSASNVLKIEPEINFG